MGDDVVFTPGPWFVFSARSIRDGRGAEVAHTMFRTTNAERRANGRLIAAAPDMLDALSECVNLLEGWHKLNFADDIQLQAVRYAHKAIAKARGESVSA